MRTLKGKSMWGILLLGLAVAGEPAAHAAAPGAASEGTTAAPPSAPASGTRIEFRSGRPVMPRPLLRLLPGCEGPAGMASG